jgi:hypothetical protein
MKNIITDTIIDGLKLLPFLFIAFLIIELIEHKLNDTSKNKITQAGKKGPIIGSILGLIPQCGFSVIATNLYITRIITLGTLISIYLVTSDEMLPILITGGAKISEITIILLIKFIIGITSGIIIDKINKNQPHKIDYSICQEEHCNCHKNIIKSSITHTLKTFVFIFIITFVLNTLLHYIKIENISNLVNHNVWYTPFIIGLVGLIPNCASSIIISELYLNNILSLGNTITGLLANSGLALLILFQNNKSLKDTFKIIIILYFIAVFSGIIINLF